MSRIVVDLPSNFLFSTSIPIRITDLNYGGHVGNDTILSLVHEARIQFLRHFNYTEKNMAGAGMIMGDVAISFKNELFYGDVILVSISVADISKVSFDILYKLEKELDGKKIPVAFAKTGMIRFDYEKRKVISIPEAVKKQWAASPL